MEANNMRFGRSCTLLIMIFAYFLNNGIEGRFLSKKNLEIKRYLKKMNKPAVKTIKSPSGDLIDCVDIYKQPSLDHPLLKNHKVQLKPSFNPSDIHSEESLTKIPQDWHISGKCPKGTIPIRRIQESHILRTASLESFGKKYPPKTNISLASAKTGNVHAVAYIINNGPHYGSRCDINLWKPRVEPSDFSLVQMWIVSNADNQNTIEAGLMVYPKLYGDNDTRLFTYWTADAYQSTGCYNLLCQGFIQTSNAMTLDAKFAPISKYGGKQFLVTFQILKDNQHGGNWWLTVMGHALGYWPNELLKELQGGANLIEWGGEVFISRPADQGSSTTQMGSGHFSGEGHKKAAYVRNIATLDENGAPVKVSGMGAIVESPECYDVRLGDNPSEFYYGGPGRNPNCP